MKKVVSILVLSCLVLTGAFAQNTKPNVKPKSNQSVNAPKGAAPKGDPRANFVPQPGDVFFGTITYKMTPNKEHPNMKKQSLSNMPTQGTLKLSPKAKSANQKPEEPKMNQRPDKGAIYFTKEGTYVDVMGVSSWQMIGKPLYLTMQRGPEEPFVCLDLGLDIPRMEEESNKMLERTEKTKTIAGVKTTMYISHYPEMEGELWVAEEIWLKTSAVPFVGLMHPVLEFDYTVTFKEEVMYSAHMVATSFMRDRFDKERVALMRSAEMIPPEEFHMMLIKQRDME